MAGMDLFVHNGPGILSKRINVPISHTKIELTSYQCLVQFSGYSLTFSNHSIVYKGEVYFSNVLFINMMESILFHYPTQVCANLYCVIYLHSPENSILKLKVWNTSFSGKQTRDCSYGGISVLDFTEEVFAFCENGIYRNIVDSFWHRVLYVELTWGLIFLHSYVEYSSLSCHINISAVNCNLVKLTVCGDYQTKALEMGDYFTHVQSLDPTKCTVLQLSSGLHEKNYLLDFRMSVTFLKFKKGIIYPLCKAVQLKMDQTRYNEKGVHFKVNGLIQKYDFVSEVAVHNFQNNKAFKGKITLTKYCNEMGKMIVNSSLAVSETFDFTFVQMFHKAPCHIELSASYHIKTTMTVYKVDFPYLSSNWLVLVVNTSNVNFKNVVQLNRIHVPSDMELRQAVQKFGSFRTKNLVLSDTSFMVLRIKSKVVNHSNSLPLLLYFEAETTLRNLYFRKHLDTVPEIYHKIYPSYRLWESYQYLLQGNLNDHILIALQGHFFSLEINFKPGQNKSKRQVFGTKHADVFYHWITQKEKLKFKVKFWNTKIGNNPVFTARKGKFIFSIPFHGIMGYKRGKISWVNAFQFCKQTKSGLPKFFSQDALEELLFLLKTSSDLLTITTMFIDLRVKFSQVR